MGRLATFKEFFKIDRIMFPIKMHFIFYSLATTSVLSYLPLIAKSIGISATAVGIIYTVSPFVTILGNPVFGWITDKLKRVKLILVALIITQTPMAIGTVFIPSLPTVTMSFPVELSCQLNSSYTISSPKFIDLSPKNISLKCKWNCEKCLQVEASTIDLTLCGKDIEIETEQLFNTSSSVLPIINISFNGTQLIPMCHKNSSEKCQATCDYVKDDKTEGKSEFFTYQFWVILIFILSTLVSVNAALAIGDAACYEVLEGKVNEFGKHRVWLSIGWGLGAMVTGYLIDTANPNNDGRTDYSFCAYVMIVLVFFDVIALSQTTLTKAKESKHIIKDVGKIFARPHTIFFATAVLLIGMLSAIQWRFAFWYLEDMGASKFLLGLSSAVVCLVVESLFMFTSGWIVKRIGRDNSIILTFLSYTVWMIPVSFISNPWWVLLINLTQGAEYGLFYFTMSSYGKLATAPGTEATIQTLLGAIYHGFGVGSGSLLGGLLFDALGGKYMYRYTGIVALGLAVLYKLITVFVAGEDSAIQGDKPVTSDAKDSKSDMQMSEISAIT